MCTFSKMIHRKSGKSLQRISCSKVTVQATILSEVEVME